MNLYLTNTTQIESQPFTLVVKAINESAPSFVQPYPLLFPISHPSKSCPVLALPLQLSANFRMANQSLTVPFCSSCDALCSFPTSTSSCLPRDLCPNNPPPTCSQFFSYIFPPKAPHICSIFSKFLLRTSTLHALSFPTFDPFKHPIFFFCFL